MTEGCKYNIFSREGEDTQKTPCSDHEISNFSRNDEDIGRPFMSQKKEKKKKRRLNLKNLRIKEMFALKVMKLALR